MKKYHFKSRTTGESVFVIADTGLELAETLAIKTNHGVGVRLFTITK